MNSTLTRNMINNLDKDEEASSKALERRGQRVVYPVDQFSTNNLSEDDPLEDQNGISSV